MSFLVVFKICLGSETHECNGEVGLLLVPTPLEATVTTLVKNSLKKMLVQVHLLNQEN